MKIQVCKVGTKTYFNLFLFSKFSYTFVIRQVILYLHKLNKKASVYISPSSNMHEKSSSSWTNPITTKSNPAIKTFTILKKEKINKIYTLFFLILTKKALNGDIPTLFFFFWRISQLSKISPLREKIVRISHWGRDGPDYLKILSF